MFSTLSYPINLESCINWLLFIWNCIFWTLRNRAYQTFLFPLRPTARFNLIPCTCTFYACIPSPRPYRTRRMQFQTNFLAPYKSTWLHFHGLIYVIVVTILLIRSINNPLDVCIMLIFPYCLSYMYHRY